MKAFGMDSSISEEQARDLAERLCLCSAHPELFFTTMDVLLALEASAEMEQHE